MPDGFLIVSVQDHHDGRPYEHVSRPRQGFDHLVMPGPLEVTVERVGSGSGSLAAEFTDLTGREVAGGGRCELE